MKILWISLVVLLFSCNNTTSNLNRSDEDIKLDLADLSLVIPMIEAGLEVVDEVDAFSISRSLDPTAVNVADTAIMETYFGSSWSSAPLVPSVVFSNHGTSGQTLRIPSAGLIKGIYNDVNNDFYLTMDFVSGAKYLIKLYIYPRDNFNTDYIYLEYFVNEDDITTWEWSYYNNRDVSLKYSQEITYYRDGTYSDRNSEGHNAELFNEIKNDAPLLTDDINTIISDISSYDYPNASPTITTSAGTWSSYTSSVVKGTKDRQDVEEYYTEDGEYGYSYMFLEGIKRKDFRQNVTRYIKNNVTGVANVLSMNTNGSSYTEMNRINKTSTTYNSETHVWNTSPSSSLDVNTANSTYNELVKNGDLYEGTLMQYWGSGGVEYDYSIDTTTGQVSMAWLSNISRSLSSATIDLTDLSDITISSVSPNWTFNGAYEMGSLFGTYTYNNVSTYVVIDLEGIEIDSEFYTWR